LSCMWHLLSCFSTAAATTQVSALSLHDALPISRRKGLSDGTTQRRPRRDALAGDLRLARGQGHGVEEAQTTRPRPLPRILAQRPDRKSTRLNSSHVKISYAVFCLKKKK